MVDVPVVETLAVETPAVDQPIHFNNDGTFGDGWQGTLEEGLREEKSLATFKNVNDLAKSFVSTKSMVGKDTIAIPTDASTEQEWEAYHVAGGRPDTVEDYGLKVPEGFPEEVVEKIFPKERLTAWQDRFFKAGISKKAADKFIADYAQDILLDLQNMKREEEQQMAELKSGLHTDWGNAYEQKKHIGNIAMEKAASTEKGDVVIVDEEFKARLVEKAGNDPDIIRAFANIGSRFIDGKSPNYTNIPTPSDLQTQIDKIQENPLYLNGTTEQRMKLANQIMAIREKMKPEAKTT